MIDWYYIYSQRYERFHEYLQNKVDKDIYNLRGLFVDQSVFDEHLYKHENEHFFGRITVKVEAIIMIIKNRMTYTKEPFFFSDCDIMIGSLVNTLSKYINAPVDIYFQQEYRGSDVVNPGFMLIWPNEKTLAFWNYILNDIVKNNTMEMGSINLYIKEGTINHKVFSYIDVCTTLTYSQKDYGICHLLSSAQGREDDMLEKLFQTRLLGQPL